MFNDIKELLQSKYTPQSRGRSFPMNEWAPKAKGLSALGQEAGPALTDYIFIDPLTARLD